MYVRLVSVYVRDRVYTHTQKRVYRRQLLVCGGLLDVWWEGGQLGTGSTAPPNTGGLNGRGGWYWVPSPHSHHPHTTAPNPLKPPTSVRLPPRLPTHSPPDCRRGNNLQPNQHNVFSNNDFHPLRLRHRHKNVSKSAKIRQFPQCSRLALQCIREFPCVSCALVSAAVRRVFGYSSSSISIGAASATTRCLRRGHVPPEMCVLLQFFHCVARRERTIGRKCKVGR